MAEKRKPGRPRIGDRLVKQVNIALDPGVIDRLDRLADIHGITRSEAVRQMVARYLGALESAAERQTERKPERKPERQVSK